MEEALQIAILYVLGWWGSGVILNLFAYFVDLWTRFFVVSFGVIVIALII